MEVFSVNGVQEFTEKLKSLADRAIVLFFFMEGSPECNQMNDIITELQNDEKNKIASVIKINASKDEDICKSYKATEVPAFVFINSSLMGGDVADTLIGANVPAFTKMFADNVDKLQKFRERLQQLTNQAKVMLFMKGNRTAPRCGFSKQAINLLQGYGVDFETFDILEDFEVREGLKKFSNWPTYPQLYVNGELVGGLDILKELAESGELKEMLSAN